MAASGRGCEIARVSVVIPARNAQATIEVCLESLVPFLERGDVCEILLVDDGSTDNTRDLAVGYPVTILDGPGEGPGAARNVGWKAASASLIWFIDSDCKADSRALKLLLPHLGDGKVAAVGGSYTNLCPDSLLACMIHEEIIERHLSMPTQVNFLATFNVVYRRDVLEECGGFDESFRLAQDAELAYRVQALGYSLRFEPQSTVGHHHPTRLWCYLKTQARHGYYRVRLYQRHPQRVQGDDYSRTLDYWQPPLALFTTVCFLSALIPQVRSIGLIAGCAFGGTLLILSAPLTIQLLRRTARWPVSCFWPMSWLRSLVRGVGIGVGVWSGAVGSVSRKSTGKSANPRTV